LAFINDASTCASSEISRLKEYSKRKLPKSVNASLNDFQSSFLTLMKTQSFKDKLSGQMIPNNSERKSQPSSSI
jgi:hypothetical protein